jgi:hypothetical protein
MTELVLAIFATAIGALFCFRGYFAMRILFPLWGLVAGYWAGAELVHLITDEGFFGTTLSIVVGICFALLGAILAYLYYSVAVLIFMGMVGFWLGAGFIQLFSGDPGIISSTVGIALGALFVFAGLVGNAPKMFLLILTSFAGSGLAVAGTLLLINVVSLQEFEDGPFAVVGDQGLFWRLVALGLAVAGLLSQTVAAQSAELQWAQEWNAMTKEGAK